MYAVPVPDLVVGPEVNFPYTSIRTQVRTASFRILETVLILQLSLSVSMYQSGTITIFKIIRNYTFALNKSCKRATVPVLTSGNKTEKRYKS